MTTLITQLITKMGLRDESNVLEKTTELLRLLELRSSNVPLQVNEYGKIVLCADIAAAVLGIAFDQEQALKLSSLRKSHYANNKRMFEKLLDLNKIVGVNDICVQLNLNEVTKKAEELLQLYKKVVVNENPDVDVAHPQYAAMAVFHACKLLKKKVSKTKLMPFSNLRPAQWQNLDLRWERMLAKHYNDSMGNKLNQQNMAEQPADSANKPKLEEALKSAKTEIEDYEKWKQRILAMAHDKLKELETNSNSFEKENLVEVN